MVHLNVHKVICQYPIKLKINMPLDRKLVHSWEFAKGLPGAGHTMGTKRWWQRCFCPWITHKLLVRVSDNLTQSYTSPESAHELTVRALSQCVWRQKQKTLTWPPGPLTKVPAPGQDWWFHSILLTCQASPRTSWPIHTLKGMTSLSYSESTHLRTHMHCSPQLLSPKQPIRIIIIKLQKHINLILRV